MEAHEIEMYKEMVRQHRGTPGQIGAGSVESQQARFIVIRNVLDSMLGEAWNSMRLLDFGCGTGDLAVWLRAHSDFDPVSRYVGVDAIKENIDDARAKGDFDFRNELWDGDGRIANDDFDLIVFSGTMNTTRMVPRANMYQRLLEQATRIVVPPGRRPPGCRRRFPPRGARNRRRRSWRAWRRPWPRCSGRWIRDTWRC